MEILDKLEILKKIWGCYFEIRGMYGKWLVYVSFYKMCMSCEEMRKILKNFGKF